MSVFGSIFRKQSVPDRNTLNSHGEMIVRKCMAEKESKFLYSSLIFCHLMVKEIVHQSS